MMGTLPFPSQKWQDHGCISCMVKAISATSSFWRCRHQVGPCMPRDGIFAAHGCSGLTVEMKMMRSSWPW